MIDKEFYEKLDKLMNQLIVGVPNIVVDIGLLNDVMIELHRRMEADK